MSLPANVGVCTVIGRYISAVVDGEDSGSEPDGVPVSGLTITFTCSLRPPIVKNSEADPPVSVLVNSVVVHTNSDGVLVGPDGLPGVLLVASDYPDPDNPWPYRVTIQGTWFPKVSFWMVAPAGQTIDLTTVLEAPSGSGFDTSAWMALTGRVEAAVASINSGQFVKTINGNPPDVSGNIVISGGGGSGTVASTDITDATAVGRSVLTAASAATARTAIGAGTSSLVVGTASGTAADAATTATALATKADASSLAPVATSGSYNDLSDKPTAPSAGVSSVNTRTGAVLLTSDDVGLGNVQNLAVYVLAVGDPDPTTASPAGLYVRQTS